MAEEHTEDKKETAVAEDERLFDLLEKQELTDEQKSEIKTLLDGHPERLVSEAFTARFDIPDMKGDYKTPEDLKPMLDRSEKAGEKIRNVLDNLKKLNEEGLLQSIKDDEVEKNPSAYLLDNAYLPNGELIGTQMAKNISFMKGLQRNEKGDLTPAQVAQITEHKDKNSVLLFQKLYDKEKGYGANSNKRNKAGEKVTDVMRLSVALENLYQNLYQGKTLTAEGEKAVADKEREDADMEAKDGDEKRHEPKKHKDKFKDEDVIRYLYEDVFLEGLSWIFDKIEDGITLVVDTAADDFRNMIASYKKDNAEMKDKRLNVAKEKVVTFNEGFTNEFNGLNSTILAKRKAYAETLKDLRDNIDHPTPELKEKFGAEFVEKLSKDPNKDKFFKQAEKIVSGELEYLYATSGLGLRLARAEMVDEFMHDDKSWRKKKSEQESKHEYKKDEDLQEQLRQNAVKHQQDIREAFVAEAERVRAVAESDYALLESNDDKKRFYAAVIPTGREGDDLRRQMAEVDAMNRKESAGAVLGNENKVKRARFEQEIFALYGQKAANAYLKQVADLVKEAEDKQKTLDKDGRYDACGKAPKDEVRSVLGQIASLNKQTKQKAVDDGKIFDELPKDLNARNKMYEGVGSVMDLESAGKIEGKEVFANAQAYSDLQVAKIEQAALHNKERKNAFKQRAEQIVQRNKAKQFQKDVMLGTAGLYQTDRYMGR